MIRALLLTGYARSGMTLLNRLLSAHPGSFLADRVALAFLAEAMQACRAGVGLPAAAYPLGPLFDEQPDLAAVTRHFGAARWDAGEPCPGLGEACPGGNLGEVLAGLAVRHSARAGKGSVAVKGLRDHFSEALAPVLLAQGLHVLVILRDPLDLVASARMGDHGNQLNRRVRVLDMVRQWRKSVALALELEGHPAFRAVRFEDLVAGTGTWESICSWLDLAPIPAGELLASGPDGPWAGNSSFELHSGLSRSPIGRGARLPDPVREFVAGATAPERWLLGYAPDRPALVPYGPGCELDRLLAPEGDQAEFETGREARRLAVLEEPAPDPPDLHRWLLSERAALRLRTVWSGLTPPARVAPGP